MPESSDVDQALIDLLLADATLMALAPDGVFMDEAGKSLATGGNATRFVIVSLVDETDEPMFQGTAFEDALYLVKAVALSTAGGNVKAAAARIHALLHFGDLTVAGYGLMVMRRRSRIRLTDVDQVDPSIRWFHRGGRYQVMVAPAAA
jgi:hypothetical protein